jgi:hypothetical protein
MENENIVMKMLTPIIYAVYKQVRYGNETTSSLPFASWLSTDMTNRVFALYAPIFA